ncbi:MAG: sigma-70 family RNA polymerase sigma factor [Piscinibacter sp.]|nr:sigma-70 family RNA polymerase sigma factor [Piscinibacter sp.]
MAIDTCADESHHGSTDELVRALEAASGTDGASAEELFPLLYKELHRIARRQLFQSAGHVTLGATTLLHEAYVGLRSGTALFPDRARFFSYAARAMRGLIIDYVRERRALKRGGAFELTSLDTDAAENLVQPDDLLPLGRALDDLAKMDPDLAELVDLKFFSGFSFCEIAEMRNVSERTIRRSWQKARLILHDTLRDG